MMLWFYCLCRPSGACDSQICVVFNNVLLGYAVLVPRHAQKLSDYWSSQIFQYYNTILPPLVRPEDPGVDETPPETHQAY